MKEIVIGGNIEPNYNSRGLWDDANISENSKFYILENKLFDYRIYLVKESEEGRAIRIWLSKDENKNNESVDNKSLNYIMPFITKDDIIEKLKIRYDQGFKRGYEKSQREIRKAIGLPV